MYWVIFWSHSFWIFWYIYIYIFRQSLSFWDLYRHHPDVLFMSWKRKKNVGWDTMWGKVDNRSSCSVVVAAASVSAKIYLWIATFSDPFLLNTSTETLCFVDLGMCKILRLDNILTWLFNQILEPLLLRLILGSNLIRSARSHKMAVPPWSIIWLVFLFPVNIVHPNEKLANRHIISLAAGRCFPFLYWCCCKQL